MSGGDKVGGKPFEWTKSGKNSTSNSTSYNSGSEPGSGSGLGRVGAGPTTQGSSVGKKSEQGDNREASGSSQHSQQLKFYGRRNRAKHVVSVQVSDGNDVEGEGAGLGGCLAVDLTEQLESGSDPTRKLSLVNRNGSGGMASGKGTSRLGRAGSQREVKMGEGVSDSSTSKGSPEAVAAVGTGGTVEVFRGTEISVEDSRVLGKSGPAHLDYLGERKKNGIFRESRGDEKGDVTVRSLEVYDDLEAHISPDHNDEAALAWIKADTVASTEVVPVAVEQVFQERLSGKDTASSSTGNLTGDQGTLDADDGDVEYAGANPHSNEENSPGIALVQDSGMVLSLSSPSRVVGFPSNGELDSNCKKGPGRSSSRACRNRGQSFRDGDEQSGGDTSKGSEDQESSVLKGMPLQWRLALERRQYEESVLAKADDVFAKQEILDSSKKIPSKGKEPARCKTHWDFVLEEMTWLAKDFERERKWKLSQAKKVVIRVSRSKLDVEAKGLRRQKEEEQKTRRVASNIAKDVKKFWMKVEKLVMYKHQLELEERRKKALDKHLDFLLGQTERYSTMLAENLGESSAPSMSKSLPSVPLASDSPTTGVENLVLGKEIVLRNDGSGSSTQSAPINEANLITTVSKNLSESKDSLALEAGVTTPVLVKSEDVKHQVDAGDEDFNMDNEIEEEDDEATIEAEEALITDEERREELSALQREGELSLEELLKLYRGDGDDLDQTDDSQSEEEDEADDLDYEKLKNDASGTVVRIDGSGSSSLSAQMSKTNINATAPGSKDTVKLETRATASGGGKFEGVDLKLQVDTGDEDFNMDNEIEEEDDEATIEAEEALVTEEEKREELSALQREGELPLEELLKLYRREGDDSDQTSDSVSEEEDETDDDDYEKLKKDKSELRKNHLGPSSSQEEVNKRGQFNTVDQARVYIPLQNGTLAAHGMEGYTKEIKTGLADNSDLEFPQVTFSPREESFPDGSPIAQNQSVAEVSLEVTLKEETLCEPDLLPEKKTRNGEVSGAALFQEADESSGDGDYIPAALADGTEEDDEATLDEEELLSRTEADEHADEVDRLKKECEMSIEDILAQYRSMGGDSDIREEEEFEGVEGDYIEDRQDRTSEAGTSGSSEDDEEVEYKYLTEDSAEAKERMGEPSTSGRVQWSLVSSAYGRKPKKKSMEVPETIEKRIGALVNNRSTEMSGRTSIGDEKNGTKVKFELGTEVGTGENGGAGEESASRGSTGIALLLGANEVVDEATAEALARVSAAAKRRGERILKRSQREGEHPTSLHSREEQITEGTASDLVLRGDPSGGVSQDVVEAGVSEEIRNLLIEDEKSLQEDLVNYSPGKVPGKVVAGETSVPADGKTSEDKLADAAAAAQSAQPTGYTFSTTKVRTKLPFLLKHSLREYQHIGLDWLVTMYEKRLNGILADEMGLGKTIMTISLLAHLACDRGIWGPHLIVVPTSVMLNWETEFMKWCPAFKILTYFGSAKERKLKRQGWSKPNSFHVCITTYRLVIQDAKAFKRKKWKYLILDEAHLIKNWKSQRWQTLLNFNSKRRILLTGTPLQNDLMELWSLMHFLMPHVFQSHQEFRDWFSNPITGMVEGQEVINKEVVDRLHNVLRPFLLRRLKKDVEKQLPQKYEHVIHCRLSKRQRNLYEDFMASSDTQATLSSGNFLGLINVLMQLRKVCNHPDLFEGRPIVSSFDMVGLDLHLSSVVASALDSGPFCSVNLKQLNLIVTQVDLDMASWECEESSGLCTPGALIEELSSTGEDSWQSKYGNDQPNGRGRGIIEEIQAVIRAERAKQKKEKAYALMWLNMLRCKKNALYGSDVRQCVSMEDPVQDVHKIKADPRRFLEFSSVVADIVHLPLTRLEMSMSLVESFIFCIPAARAPAPVAWCSHRPPTGLLSSSMEGGLHETVSASLEPLRPVFVRRQLFFPDRRLLQFDCGKLQELAVLLRRLKSEGHRALIFTQMTRMLDVLESFINLYGYTYMRLDGSTKPEQRQILMQRFNTNPKIFLFILSTRSGGVGINLVGADTVIFYDSDWNPAMDQQAQDRCHRIGQTREVHIYRLVSESTIEENILKKANQKRLLDDLVIQSGGYNTEFFKKLDPMELFSGMKGVKVGGERKISGLLPASESESAHVKPSEVSSAEVEAALKNAEDEADFMAMKRVEQEEAAENQEFTEESFVGSLEDEELVDDVEEGKGVVVRSQSDGAMREGLDNSKMAVTADEAPQIGSALIPADAEEEMDMLADVKQMAAAAAAAGRGSISFEDQLQPVERYAMRYLELWDPRVDKASEAAQVLFEEKEWELEKLEKLKEEQEAEIDEDNEPLFYESWDTAFANEAYRQQVEVLAQQQENQRQLEWEAMEEEMRDADRAVAEAASAVVGAENFKVKSKSLKKMKKPKFKSLIKGSLTFDDVVMAKKNVHRDETYSTPQFELSSLPSRSPSQRKRKAPKLLEEDMLTETHAKKANKELNKERSAGDRSILSKRLSEFEQLGGGSDDDTQDLDTVPTASKFPTSISVKKKTGGKISIMAVPLKKGPLIMLEKERKKDATKMQEHVPPADSWTPAEDAILCAVVHEYGGNWPLASDALAGIPDGNIYRGRHRHPLHCRERFRQLLAQNAAAATGDPTSEKNALTAASNAHMKVTEEHTKRLLGVLLQLPDNEPLLQRHFAALLTAVRNNQARSRARGDKIGLAGPRVVTSPEGGDFLPLSRFSQPVLSSYVIPTHQSSSKFQSLLDEALASADVDDDSDMKSKDVMALELHSQDEQGPIEIEDEPEEEKESIMGYLDSDAAVMATSDHDSDLFPSKYTSPLLSAEDVFGCTPVTVHVLLPPANAVRASAENVAEHRFRMATNSGWGPGVYDWAGAAVSGLGSAGIPSKAKSKKRPPSADASKPPKSKQPKNSKVSKKVSPDATGGVMAGVSSLVNGTEHSVDASCQPTVDDGPSIAEGARSVGVPIDRPPGEQEPGKKALENTRASKVKVSGSGTLSKKERKKMSESGNASGVNAPVGKSKAKAVKMKSGESHDAAAKKFAGSPSIIDIVDGMDIDRGSRKTFCEVSPLEDVEILVPDIGTAVDDLTESGSDDEVVITGVSYPAVGRSDPVSQVPFLGKKSSSQPKGDRGPKSYVPVERLQSEKSGHSRMKEGGSGKPKGSKHKSWPEVASISRVPHNVPLEVPVSVSSWVLKAGKDATGTGPSSKSEVLPVAVIPIVSNRVSGSPHRSKKAAARPTSASSPGLEHMSPSSIRSTKESQLFNSWVPPTGLWPSSAPSFPSLNLTPDSINRISSDVFRRTPSNNSVRRSFTGSSAGHASAGHSPPRVSLSFSSASPSVPVALDSYTAANVGTSHISDPSGKEDPPASPPAPLQQAQVSVSGAVGGAQDRDSNPDPFQNSSQNSTFYPSSSSVAHRQSPAKRPSLLSSSPRLSHREQLTSHHSLSQSAASQRETSGGPDLGLSLGRRATLKKSQGSTNHDLTSPTS